MMRRPATKLVRRCAGADDLQRCHPRRSVGVAQPEIPSQSPESHLRVASMAHKNNQRGCRGGVWRLPAADRR